MKSIIKSPVQIMGVVNVSPESFYKGSVYSNQTALVKAVRKMEEEGADLIDVGAQSSAPYLETQISEQEEAKRLLWALRILKKNTRLPISVDTFRPYPARLALTNGGSVLNDIHGLRGDPEMAKVAKIADRIIVMSHPHGEVEKKMKNPAQSVLAILDHSLKIARQNGISLAKIIIDPGIGFFRNTPIPWWKWDLAILQNLDRLASLKCPILVGVSRKSFLGHLQNGAPAEDRLPASLAATISAVQKGASLIRTHDVGATKAAIQTWSALPP